MRAFEKKTHLELNLKNQLKNFVLLAHSMIILSRDLKIHIHSNINKHMDKI